MNFVTYHAAEPGIWELLQLTYTIDLSKEKKNAFNLRRNVLSGEEYYKYDFDILMKRESALFKFWIEKDGVLKGEGKVAYNHAKPQVTGFNW